MKKDRRKTGENKQTKTKRRRKKPITRERAGLKRTTSKKKKKIGKRNKYDRSHTK